MASESINYFASHGKVCPENSNPADFFMKLMNPEVINNKFY